MRENSKKQTWIIGIDEVGRGPLAGPVYVCAVAMKKTQYEKTKLNDLTDSKKLSRLKREKWYAIAKEMEKNGQLHISLAKETAKMIDQKGIVWCIRQCIETCLKELSIDPQDVLILLDGGLKAPKEYLYQQTVIKGDQIHKIISLASVVAKVTRDAYMTQISLKYPFYSWEMNKGYGTKTHIKSLKNHGTTRLHRQTFLKWILDI